MKAYILRGKVPSASDLELCEGHDIEDVQNKRLLLREYNYFRFVLWFTQFWSYALRKCQQFCLCNVQPAFMSMLQLDQ